jgi:hypothetical protein
MMIDIDLRQLTTHQTTVPETVTPISPDIHVRLDDRARLMSVVYAITPTADAAHARRPHSAHSHARATRKHFADFREHAAVQTLQTLLEQTTPIEAIFNYALRLNPEDLSIVQPPSWAPAEWNAQLNDFRTKANVTAWLTNEATVWERSKSEAERMFKHAQFKPFLKPFLGDIEEALVFMPNISYPAEQEIGVRIGMELVSIIPPRPAWGDSAPWPFDEDAGFIFRAALGQYVRILINEQLALHKDKLEEASQTELPINDEVRTKYPTWKDQFLNLFVTGLVAIYLEDHMSAMEAKAYTLMESKVHGNAMLPGVVSVLRRYLGDAASGKYVRFIDYLPLFPKQLKVAKRIFSL